MKKILIVIFILILGITSGCSKAPKEEDSMDLLNFNWEETLVKSKGSTVSIHMWGGSDLVNRYIDEWVKPRVKEKYDIKLNRVPINDAKDMINKLLTEKQVDKKDGSIDVFWINGENFKTSKDNELLWASFAEYLPNYNKYVDKEADDIKYDFGEETLGMEVPWGKSQFVFIYDSAKITDPPKSMEELKKWVKNNPGKFTYPAPPDFSGSAFVRNALLETTGGYNNYLGSINKEKLEEQIKTLWDYLNEIEQYLWREGKTYPESSTKLDQLYENGEVWMTLSYNPVHASSKIKSGQFPDSSRTFLLENGTLSNTHYLSIPFNSKNKAGAMVVIDFLLSPEAQIAKFDPSFWGDGLGISYDKLSKQDKDKVDSIDRGIATLSPEALKKHRVPEISSRYIDIIEKGWIDNVAK